MPAKKKQPVERQSFLASVGVEVNDVGTPFFKVSGRKQTVTVTGARPPTADEAVKELPEGGKLPILAILDVEVQGVPHVWEISSKRLLHALDAAMESVPCDLEVKSMGSGISTTFSVQLASAVLKCGSLAAPCDAPRCVLPMGHTGPHMTENGVADAAE